MAAMINRPATPVRNGSPSLIIEGGGVGAERPESGVTNGNLPAHSHQHIEA